MTVEEKLVQELRDRAARAPRAGHRAEWAHSSLPDLLLARGRLFTPAELPAQIRRLPARQCFANAFALATVRSELVYAEGYAVYAVGDTLLPLQHAWCVAPDGSVVDPTWETPGAAYLGLPIGPVLGPPGLGPGLIHEITFLAQALEAGLPAEALVDLGRPVAQESVG